MGATPLSDVPPNRGTPVSHYEAVAQTMSDMLAKVAQKLQETEAREQALRDETEAEIQHNAKIAAQESAWTEHMFCEQVEVSSDSGLQRYRLRKPPDDNKKKHNRLNTGGFNLKEWPIPSGMLRSRQALSSLTREQLPNNSLQRTWCVLKQAFCNKPRL